MDDLEKKVLEVLEQAEAPSAPESVQDAVSQATEASKDDVRDALWRLIGRGAVRVVGDWQVQAVAIKRP